MAGSPRAAVADADPGPSGVRSTVASRRPRGGTVAGLLFDVVLLIHGLTEKALPDGDGAAVVTHVTE